MSRIPKAVSILVLGTFLAGCASSPTFVSPGSSIAADVTWLYKLVMILSIAVFLLVESLLVYNILRFRRKPGDDSPATQVYGNTRLEIIWTSIPILLVAVLFALTLRTVNAVAAPVTKTAQDVNVHVIGHQWWWEFDYPDLGIVTANELHVPVDANVNITLDSVDVIHSFWVPKLSGKTDVIPGQTNHMWFRADKVGDYHGQCAEFCGLNHANMRIKVVVETSDDFQSWVTNQQQPPAQPQTDLQKQGYKILTSGICSNCHLIENSVNPPGANSGVPSSSESKPNGYKVQRPVGPNLGHLFSRSVFAGATYDLTEENLRRWLTDNQEMKPGNDMSLNPKPSDLEPLIAYLTTLK